MKPWKVISGFLSGVEAEELQRLCSNKVCLEIGSLYGRSTVCIAEVAKSIHAIDSWEVEGNGQTRTETINQGIFNSFKESIAGYKNITYSVGFSYNILPTIGDGLFDIVFIDSLHTYEGVAEDTWLSFPKLKEDGVFIYHDYGAWPEVTKAVDSLFHKITSQKGTVVSTKKTDYKGEKYER